MGAATVDAALSVARTENIDVALCDVVMPFAGGPEFALAMHSGPGNVPLVLMTGNPSFSPAWPQARPCWRAAPGFAAGCSRVWRDRFRDTTTAATVSPIPLAVRLPCQIVGFFRESASDHI